MSCEKCPIGALCTTNDCALQDDTLMCSNKSIVGSWQRNPLDLYALKSCPEGHQLVNSTDGTAFGTFSHDAQQCKPCLDTQYIIDPNTNICQKCPPGLECIGTSEIQPVVSGSVWESVGAVYKLRICPRGYRLYNLTNELQECQPCGLGEECEREECTHGQCTPCDAGKYKDSTGPHACIPCPLHTYNPVLEATALAQCRSCPPFSYTSNVRRTDVTECTCDERYYLAVDGSSRLCVSCPEGAKCSGGICALSLDGNVCPETNTSVTGDWKLGSGGEYALISCPEGHQLVNSTDGTSTGTFSHDAQQCKPCLPDTQYIINPNTDVCQRCPPGLGCQGTSQIHPVVIGSTWESVGAVYKLRSCPRGYRLYNLTDELQECQPCGLGEECDRDVCYQCSPCRAGTYKDVFGISLCAQCPLHSFGPGSGATSLAECLPCPVHSFTTFRGETDISTCMCDSKFYLAVDGSSRLCVSCPEGAKCSGGICALSLDGNVCPETNTSVTGDWKLGSGGEYSLISCPEGHQLVNSTDGTSTGTFSHDAQQCKPCLPDTQYIINPNTDVCQKCPPGLGCQGTSQIHPVVIGSTWESVGAVYKLRSCPRGYRLYNLTDELQECQPCGLGEECDRDVCYQCSPCRAGTYKDNSFTDNCKLCPYDRYNPVTGATSLAECVRCPSFSYTSVSGATSSTSCTCETRFYATQDSNTFTCKTCPEGAKCEGGVCSLSHGNICPETNASLPGNWKLGSGGEYSLISCPEGHQLVNSTDGTSTGTFSHDAQQCKPCLPDTQYIINPNTDVCQKCPPGLECQGTSQINPLVDGSIWESVGAVYKLRSCPRGYRLYNLTDELQECQPCGLGEECDRDVCYQCSPCLEGTYKDSEGPSVCTSCPHNTYGEFSGAVDVSLCRACPFGAVTPSTGHTSLSSCTCPLTLYRIDLEDYFACQACPSGGVCDDQTCSFHNVSQRYTSCVEANIPNGNWVQNQQGLYLLQTCPNGHQLVNSTDGTSTGTFSHDAQQCKRCLPDTQYIINPNTDSCQKCPPGLQCHGTGAVDAVVTGSEWTIEGAVYKLKSCPRGYEVYNKTDDLQECQPCGLGEECNQEVCYSCQSCQKGKYKDSLGSGICEECPRDTFGPEVGISSLDGCIKCPDFSFTDSKGTVAAEQCYCFDRHYFSLSENQIPSCSVCPVGAICSDGNCFYNYTAGAEASCPDGEILVGKWDRRYDGRYGLFSCPEGHQLVNSTEGTSSGTFSHDAQQCKPCLPNTYYIINPNTDVCQKCPPGLQCQGTSTVVPVVAGSAWEEVGAIFQLSSCPGGYKVFAESADLQECQPCGKGEECEQDICESNSCESCQPGTYKDAAGTHACVPCPQNTYNSRSHATSLTDCTACPEFSYSAQEGSADVSNCICDFKRYQVIMSDMMICSACPEGAKCPGGGCALSEPSLVCPSASEPIIGEWTVDTDGFYSVTTCPSGHQLVNSINGVFSHEAQQCKPCLPDTQYIINPNIDSCQKCPPGLQCDGGVATPVVNGSVWRAAGAVYKLQSCPRGYRLYNLTDELQECQPCNLGEECVWEVCYQCDLCEQGKYKDHVGTGSCEACPVGTYGPTVGAGDFSLCRPCPRGAATEKDESTSAADCFCDVKFYTLIVGDYLECSTCPKGAICPDSSCAFASEIQVCPDGTSIAGNWLLESSSGLYHLQSCPPGHQHINSTTGTAVGTFAHDSQQCVACKACEIAGAFCNQAEYIIDAMKYKCESCPVGAECNGDQLRTKNNLEATWTAESDGKLYLTRCPVGHRLINNRGYENQECQACPEGYFIMQNDDPFFRCHVCPETAVCQNGGPPIFNSSSVLSPLLLRGLNISLTDIDWSSPYIQRLLAEGIAYSLGMSNELVEISSICDSDDDIAGIEEALCDQARRRRSQTSMSLRQASGVTISQATDEEALVIFTVPSSVRDPASLNNQLSDPSIQQRFTQWMIENNLAISASLEMTPVIDANSKGGEVYRMNAAGEAVLVFCAKGYLLVNTTIELQECVHCKPTTYSLHPFDGCDAGKCNLRDCTPCPKGAECAGNRSFSPVVPGSVWEEQHDLSSSAMIYRLDQCPPGFVLVRTANPQEDQCIACSIHHYSLEVASQRIRKIVSETTSITVNGSGLCLECPEGGVCGGIDDVVPDAGHWRGQDMLCESSNCGTQSCRAGSCTAILSHDANDQGSRRFARVYRCPPGVCIQNFDETAADNTTNRTKKQTNICKSGHQGVLCGVCLPGYAPSMGGCMICGDEPGPVPFVIIGIFASLLMLAWYFFGWRTYLVPYEQALLASLRALLTKLSPKSNKQEEQSTEMWQDKFAKVFRSVVAVDSFKLVVSFFQVGGSFVTTFAVDWPPQLLSLLAITSALFSFDFLGFPGLACITSSTNFTAKLMINSLFPVTGIFMLILPVVAGRLMASPKCSDAVDLFFNSLFLFLFVTYPAGSFAVLKSFSCRDVGADGFWLRADLTFECPRPGTNDFTFWWAAAFTVIIPFGVPAFILGMLFLYKVPTIAQSKRDKLVVGALLQKLKQQKAYATSTATAFGAKPGRKWRKADKSQLNVLLKQAFERVKMTDQTLNKDALRILLASQGVLDMEDCEYVRILNKFGSKGVIDKKGVKGYVRECVSTFQATDTLCGAEDPDGLSVQQLGQLLNFSWHRYEIYKSSTNLFADIHDLASGEAFTKQQFDWMNNEDEIQRRTQVQFEHYSRDEMFFLLNKKAEDMEASGDLSTSLPRWDGSTEDERTAIDRLGFLFTTYKTSCWWFELAEMARKLLISGILVFIYEGTASQVGVGFVVNFGAIIVVLIKRPYANPFLNTMQVYALSIQMATLFYGMMLITAQFEELVGESNGGMVGGLSVPNLVVGLNCTIFGIPFAKVFFNMSPKDMVLKVRAALGDVFSRKKRLPALPAPPRRPPLLVQGARHPGRDMLRPAHDGPPGGSETRASAESRRMLQENSSQETVGSAGAHVKGINTATHRLGLRRLSMNARLLESNLQELVQNHIAGAIDNDERNLELKNLRELLKRMKQDSVEVEGRQISREQQETAAATVEHLQELLANIQTLVTVGDGDESSAILDDSAGTR